jgi:PhnB protein
MAVKPIPDGYHSVTPYLTVQGAARLLEFLTRAFDATVTEHLKQPDGTVGHAEVRIGDSVLMVADARGEWQPMPGAMYLYVPDADATYQRALQAGATSVMEPVTHFYGDRHGGVKDPSGNFWWIATHVEDVAPDELARRAEAFMQQQLRS